MGTNTREIILIVLACFTVGLLLTSLFVIIRDTVRVSKTKRLFLEAVNQGDRDQARLLLQEREDSDKKALALIRSISSRLPSSLRGIPDDWNLNRVLMWASFR